MGKLMNLVPVGTAKADVALYVEAPFRANPFVAMNDPAETADIRIDDKHPMSLNLIAALDAVKRVDGAQNVLANEALAKLQA